MPRYSSSSGLPERYLPLHHTVMALRRGGVVAYPTEAVYGLGCDPQNLDALQRLLDLKQRPWQKGLILIASDYQQLLPYVTPLNAALMAPVFASWPGPHTWLLPAAANLPRELCGDHSMLAVRVTAHPLAAALCDHFGGAITSTSANRSGLPPCRHPRCVRGQFTNALGAILHGSLGASSRPSTIRDARSGAFLRH
ncbi:MAG: Sua5/YciO/YrdC/YwlC family protein [Gammaproteobacteria bacterium]|nr:Sua5/YciO/YrdC/YwlC family protein [Gammaproteobacteria bacterium]